MHSGSGSACGARWLLCATTALVNQQHQCIRIATFAQDLKAELGASTQEDADLRSLEDEANAAASASVAWLQLRFAASLPKPPSLAGLAGVDASAQRVPRVS